MPRFKTTFNGYAAKFSPFVDNRLAVATAQNFGIIGNGRLHVLEVSATAAVVTNGHRTRSVLAACPRHQEFQGFACLVHNLNTPGLAMH